MAPRQLTRMIGKAPMKSLYILSGKDKLAHFKFKNPAFIGAVRNGPIKTYATDRMNNLNAANNPENKDKVKQDHEPKYIKYGRGPHVVVSDCADYEKLADPIPRDSSSQDATVQKQGRGGEEIVNDGNIKEDKKPFTKEELQSKYEKDY